MLALPPSGGGGILVHVVCVVSSTRFERRASSTPTPEGPTSGADAQANCPDAAPLTARFVQFRIPTESPEVTMVPITNRTAYQQSVFPVTTE